MQNIEYRKLIMEECEKLNEMNPSQYIKRAWREVDGRRQLIDINYQDTDWPEGYGSHSQYALLDQLFITLEFRNQGIGKQLFKRSADAAAELGAKKLYICAGSSEETIAFYFAIGCKEAEEINQKLYDADPRDYQLEWGII